MSRRRGKPKTREEDPATKAFREGSQMVCEHPLFFPLYDLADLGRWEGSLCPPDAWAVVGEDGTIHVHPTRRAAPREWAYVLAHCLLHLGFGHFDPHGDPRAWNAACDVFIARFLAGLKFGAQPDDYVCPVDLTASSEEKLYQAILERGVWKSYVSDMVQFPWPTSKWKREIRWSERLTDGLGEAVASAVRVAAGVEETLGAGRATTKTPLRQAIQWLISSYPLIGSLASAFEFIEDASICQRESISIAAIDDEIREVYFSPGASLNEEEYRFVVAHELLHAGLRHSSRRHGRDAYLWNIAADYVINDWLLEMGVGKPPAQGGMIDPKVRGMSAESVYDLIVTDIRRYRKLATLRGQGQGDILGRRSPGWWSTGEGLDLDGFYRQTLAQGLLYHEEQGRGFLPAGLIEEIKALALPPIPWDVELARWFDERFPPVEKVRSYARLSRRQSSTPEIPRPSYVVPQEAADGRTFGVVLDTSGSMWRNTLAKALGSIASYAIARDVAMARVVFCDAAAYDQGYMAVEDIAGRVKVRGRGGTVLQPAIDLLERAEDFPAKGPLLIITDGQCDDLTVRRDHAYLLPEGYDLPFVPRGKVFRIPAGE
jgi:predicted metal-dependent peptidase